MAGEEAVLFDVARIFVGARIHHLLGACAPCLIQHFLRQRMLRRHNHARCAVDGIHTRGEDADWSELRAEVHLCALRPSNPIPLHGEDALRPIAFELCDIRQQLIGILRDPEEPLFESALLYGRAFVPPAAAVHNLLVRQNGAALRAPVHERLFTIGDAALQHFEEEPLVPAIVIRLAGGHLAIPVVAELETAMRGLHLRDIGLRPFARRALVGDGGVLGRQAKSVPAHGVQHIEAAHPLIARQRVPNGIVPDMPDVQRARRIGQHLEHVKLRARGVLFGLIQFFRTPALVPLQSRFACGRMTFPAFYGLI